MKLPDGIQYPDGRVFDIPTNIEPTNDQDIINWLKSEIAYLRGKIEVYEKFLKDRGYIKEAEHEKKCTLADFVKGRVDDETLDRIAHKADEIQRENLSKEDKAVADKAAKLIARDYGEVIKKLEEE